MGPTNDSPPSEIPLAPDQPILTPAKLVQTYNDEEWEVFIEEWAEGFEPPYTQIVRLGGAGDMGRDIIGHLGDPSVRPCPCDVYQCKHYDHPLHPSDVYLELGKLCVYTHRGDYPVPSKYRFVSPRGVGPSLYNLLNYPDKLRTELIAAWPARCQGQISKGAEFPLEGPLKDHVLKFDFTRVWFLQPAEIIQQHQRTKYWYRRFRIDPPVRPKPDDAPAKPQPGELPYLTQLLEAYADNLKRPVGLEDLPGLPRFLTHFRQARGYFFSAEALARFSRDHFPGAFDTVKTHIYDGIVDVTLASHPDGLACLLEVMKQAAALPLPQSDLVPYVWTADKKGVCHHLSNDRRVTWVQRG